VQFDASPGMKQPEPILSILMGSMVVLAAVVVASLLRWGAGFSSKRPPLSSSLGACGSR